MDISTDHELDSSSDDEDYNVETDLCNEEANVDSADDDANTAPTPTTPTADNDDEDVGTEIKSTSDLMKEGLLLIEGYDSARTQITSLKAKRAEPNTYKILSIGTAYEKTKFNKRGFSHPDVNLTDLAILQDPDGKTCRALFLSDDDGELSFLLANAKVEQAVIKRMAAKHEVKMEYAKWISYKGTANVDCLSPKELLIFGDHKRAICLSDVLIMEKQQEKEKRSNVAPKRKRIIDDDDEPTSSAKPTPVKEQPATTEASKPSSSDEPSKPVERKSSRTLTRTLEKASPISRKRKARVQLTTPKQTTLTKLVETTPKPTPTKSAPVKSQPVVEPTFVQNQNISTPTISAPNTSSNITLNMSFSSIDEFIRIMKRLTD